MPFIVEDEPTVDMRSDQTSRADRRTSPNDPSLVDAPTDTSEPPHPLADSNRNASELDADTKGKLRKANLAAGAFHLASAAAFLLVSNDFSLPITASYAAEDPALLDGAPPTEILANPQIIWGVAAFSLLSALFHFLVATVANSTYNRGISKNQNPFRWIEYSASATLMIVLISMLLGIYDVAALIAIAGANVAMILFGWLMERHNTPGQNVDWYPFTFGSIVGLVPWIAIAFYFQGALGNAEEAVPPWVWGIILSVFALFNCFAINQFLQYKQVGRWKSYVFGESTYIVLSFVAKTLLVWQIYFGTVR